MKKIILWSAALGLSAITAVAQTPASTPAAAPAQKMEAKPAPASAKPAPQSKDAKKHASTTTASHQSKPVTKKPTEQKSTEQKNKEAKSKEVAKPAETK